MCEETCNMMYSTSIYLLLILFEIYQCNRKERNIFFGYKHMNVDLLYHMYIYICNTNIVSINRY